MPSNTLPGNSTNSRELAPPLQHDQPPRLNRIQATSTRGVRACIRRVAGCATPTGSAGHAGATANLKLTFHLDHSAGADHGWLAATWLDDSLIRQEVEHASGSNLTLGALVWRRR